MSSNNFTIWAISLPVIIIVCGVIYYYTGAIRRRFHEYLLYLQQDEYSPSRFYKWYVKNKAFDRKVTLITTIFCIIICLGIFISQKYDIKVLQEGYNIFGFIYSLSILFLYLLTVGYILRKEKDPTTQAKLQLKMTPRAIRIYSIATLFTYVLTIAIFPFFLVYGIANSYISSCFFFCLAIIAQLIPFFLMLSVVLLSPFEKFANNKYLKEAKEKFEKINPFTISIVGSYGKSTVKNTLGEILNVTKGHTFWPKAGINTIMGVTRKIREELKESDKYAVIEMGTYKKGSITNLCSLTPPKAAILTAINHMHLERFKTREKIYEAKTEVIKALPENGILVCNADDDFVLRAYKEANIKNKYLYGLEKKDGVKLDAYIFDIKYTSDGTTAKILWKDSEYELKTKIVGKGGISSLLASFTMAVALGIEPKLVLAVIKEIEPLSNRLVLKKYPNNLIYLEDGYNSNPLGFNSALEVLKVLDVKRRIVMTPGIIELGSEQFEVNYNIAKKITKICDMVIFVGTENKESFKKAFDEDNFTNISYVENRDEGFKILTEYQNENDAILIENDLPDWYESKVSF